MYFRISKFRVFENEYKQKLGRKKSLVRDTFTLTTILGIDIREKEASIFFLNRYFSS